MDIGQCRFRPSGAKWESSWVILWTGRKCILPAHRGKDGDAFDNS